MALKPCRECESQVSTNARACPHCGTDFPTPESGKDQNLMSAGVAILAVGIIVMWWMGCAGPMLSCFGALG